MFPPSDKELEDARALGIDPKGKSGPALRRAIVAAKYQMAASEQRRQQGLTEYQILVNMCRKLDITVPTGKAAPNKAVLEQQLAERLPVALAERGIVEGAVVTIPPGTKLSSSGRARVGKYSPASGGNHAVITLYFEGERGFAHNAWLVWCHAQVEGVLEDG